MKQRIVVKIGSSSLTSEVGGLSNEKIKYFVSELADLQRQDIQILLVTSGAVAAGYTKLGYPKRPRQLHEKQASAAVGQALLMRRYQECFSTCDIVAAQILLTRSDFSSRQRAHNASMTIDELLQRSVIPIVNENDTVAVDELKFGDNDTLSALVGNLVKADQLIILTDTDGLYTEDPRKSINAQRIERVDQISHELCQISGGSGSSVGTGGMRSKIEAARIAMNSGLPVFVGRASEAGDLLRAMNGNGHGTYFDTNSHNLSMKKQWIGFLSIPYGRIVIDSGAQTALLKGGKSLLPAGIIEISGHFHPGDVIEVFNQDGTAIGRGVVNYSTWQLQAAMGLPSGEVQRRIDVSRIEVIHRDEWVPLTS